MSLSKRKMLHSHPQMGGHAYGRERKGGGGGAGYEDDSRTSDEYSDQFDIRVN